jgi:SAM-dependent methyltransferase
MTDSLTGYDRFPWLMRKDLDFSTKEYWQNKYKEKETTFEWLENYSEIRDYIRSHIPCESKILIPGCGNSTMGPEMRDDRYNNIEQIDFSEVVVEQMSKRFPDMIWKVMDITHLEYDDNVFDVILDKGTIDALTCGGDVELNMKKACEEYIRVLKPGGLAYIVSFGQESDRRLYFDPEGECSWRFEGFDLLPREFAPHSHFHVYKLKKPG